MLKDLRRPPVENTNWWFRGIYFISYICECHMCKILKFFFGQRCAGSLVSGLIPIAKSWVHILLDTFLTSLTTQVETDAYNFHFKSVNFQLTKIITQRRQQFGRFNFGIWLFLSTSWTSECPWQRWRWRPRWRRDWASRPSTTGSCRPLKSENSVCLKIW